ncbi:uncharacterized protein BXZ73DRAFT_90779 [Epithele typhae]|uniref:uncharacterized protein n=1 Tax=Epithele typhae TaxID=378194 RepID=UPI0020086390|nr:uncharacterized protein BXZ73DRAFT_90779 [Epithele typhae]KAH9927070.1 hypothetical protein BXZ73DRAFT_90779 [Epithele typhae]
MSFPLFDYSDSDITLRATPGGQPAQKLSEAIDFRVHRWILSLSSTFFEGLLSIPQPPSPIDHGTPVIPFTESPTTLSALLSYIYPVREPTFASLDELVPVLEAVHKYDVTVAIIRLRAALVSPDFLAQSPLRVYGIASHYELHEEAKVASTATLAMGLNTQPLHEDLKTTTAYAYHALLLLHQRRAAAAIALLVLPDEIRCMHCSQRNHDVPPRWWAPFRAAAVEELRARPVSAVVVSMSFLQRAAQKAGCERCAASILASAWWFEQLAQRIDALPATV